MSNNHLAAPGGQAVPELTPWFPAHMKPLRVGLYRVKYGMNPSAEWCWWTGKGWCWAYPQKRDALAKAWRTTEGASQSKSWRGLAQNPAALPSPTKELA